MEPGNGIRMPRSKVVASDRPIADGQTDDDQQRASVSIKSELAQSIKPGW
jgi:hypothetical protein